MEIRSARSINAITAIRGVFNLYVSNLLCKMHCRHLFVHLFILSFSFNHCRLFLILWRTYTDLLFTIEIEQLVKSSNVCNEKMWRRPKRTDACLLITFPCQLTSTK